MAFIEPLALFLEMFSYFLCILCLIIKKEICEQVWLLNQVNSAVMLKIKLDIFFNMQNDEVN